MTVAHAPGPRVSADTPAKAWLRALERTGALAAAPTLTLPARIAALAEERGAAPAVLAEGEALSFAELGARMDGYGRWAAQQGLRPGEVVGLLMPNRPEFMAAWLGLTRVGVVVALLNSHLRGSSLAHCVRVAAPRAVIVDARLAELSDTVRQACPDARIQLVGDGGPLDVTVAEHGAAVATAPVILSDPALLIYTSGTTGLPKAARVSHHRALRWSAWFAGLWDAGPDDRLYDPLPLYHSIGGVAAAGAALLSGGSVVVRDRFSASQFWPDVVRWDCTLFQYIGELCRYLVNAPVHPDEARHRLRLACGNGLRPDIWEAFQARFEIPRVLEFYASTEGNFSLFNIEGRVGSIGRTPGFLKHRSPVVLARFDEATGEPARGADGLCIACAPGEVGEALGAVARDRPESGFEGYTDPAATERKMVRGAFQPGDAWVRTGDLMRQDGQGFFYFVDRVGDTFRWKGENVATTEVAEALASAPGVREAVVYGVAVPGADGRAGMAALTVEPGWSPEGLAQWLATRLPAYARPVFLRAVGEVAATETFKPRKAELVAESFDPGRVADPLWLLQPDGYTPLHAALHARLVEGDVRV